MKTDKKSIDKTAKQQNRKTDSQKLALKLALALSGSKQAVINEFSFFDAKGAPLHASNAGNGLVLVY